MSTNIGGIPVGQVILGVSQGGQQEQSVTSTLTFTQAIAKTNETVAQTFTLSQTIVANKINTRTVSQTWTPTQVILAPYARTVTSTLSLSHSNTFAKTKPVSVTSTYSASQTVGKSQTISRLVLSGLFLSHVRGPNGVFNRSVSHTYTPTQTIVGDRARTVTSSLAFSQTISFIKAKHVQHSLSLQQSHLRGGNFVRHVIQLYPVYHTVNRTVRLSITVQHALNLTSTVGVNRVQGVTQSLNLTQTVVGVNTKGVANTYSPTHSYSYTHVSNPVVEQSLNFTQTITLARTQSLRVKHGFGMNSTVKGWREFNKTVSQNLPLTQTIRFNVFNRSVSHTYSPTQSIAYTPIYPRTVENSLSLNQTISVVKTYNRTITSVLVFTPNRQVYVGMGGTQYVTVENIQAQRVPAYQKNKPHMILQVSNDVITLPSPEWNDGEGGGGVFTIRRSMNNIPYTYVRGLSLRKLELSWQLSKAKAHELREFCLRHNTKIINMTSWKGNSWLVYLMSNPIEFRMTGRYEAEYEKVVVDLEFEGLRVS